MAKANTIKGKTIFDLLSCVFDRKVKWDDLSEMDQKQFSPYMINRFISMDPGYIEMVNYLQRYTLSGMRPKDVYNLYLDVLPKKKFWAKYIKSKSENSGTISKLLVEFLAKNEQWSTAESEENLIYIYSLEDGHARVKNYLRRYGISEAEAVKTYGVPKK